MPNARSNSPRNNPSTWVGLIGPGSIGSGSVSGDTGSGSSGSGDTSSDTSSSSGSIDIENMSQKDIEDIKSYVDCAKELKDGNLCSKFEEAAVRAGLDPAFVTAYKSCIKGDTDACSKFAVTTAAVKACELYTGGAGAAVCSGVVPVVVDVIWPVIGPVANAITDGAKGVVSKFRQALVDIGNEFIDMFKKSKNTDVGAFRLSLQTSSEQLLTGVIGDALDGFDKVTYETRKQLGLPETSPVTWLDGASRTPRDATSQLMKHALVKDNYLYTGTFKVYGKSELTGLPNVGGLSTPLECWAIGIADWVRLKQPIAEWTPTKLTWRGEYLDAKFSPSGQGFDQGQVLFGLRDAMRQILILRTGGIQATVPKVVGRVVAGVTSEKVKADEEADAKSGGALTWLFAAAILGGAAYGGYKWYKK